MRKWVVLCAVGAVALGLAAAGLAAEKREPMMTGVIVALDVHARTMSVNDDVESRSGEEYGFVIEPSTVVRMHGMKAKLDQLKVGDVVTVKYAVRDAKNFATEIQHR